MKIRLVGDESFHADGRIWRIQWSLSTVLRTRLIRKL